MYHEHCNKGQTFCRPAQPHAHSRRAAQIYDSLAAGITLPDAADSGADAWPEVDFAALRQINPDIVAWLWSDGGLSDPVVQGEDNAYYLDHLFDRSAGAAGCLFLDCRVAADLSDTHSILYGHAMKNGTMFGTLDAYAEQAYYDAHPRLLLVTPTQRYAVELFAGYVTDVHSDAWALGLRGAALDDWVQTAVSQSVFVSDVFPQEGERILTLSTCSYDFDEARFVLHGVLRQA